MLALKAKRSNKTLYLFAAVIVTAIAVIMAERQGVVDSDYFWHITLGKSIWQNKAIPTQDTFSWLGPELNLQETAHSWLSSLILYAFSCISVNPVYGMLAFIAVTVFAYCLFIEYIWGRQIKDPFMNVLALALVTLPLDWAGRPQNIGLTLFAIGFYLLNKVYEEPDTKLRWLLPVVSVLWANLHGGALPILFAFNLLFLVLCFAPNINAFDIYNEKGDSKKRFRALFQVFLSDILAGLLNPYGIKLYIYFFVTNNETTKKHVSEWMPSHLANEVVFLCLAFLFLIVAYKMKVKLTEFAPYLCCLFMTAMYVRIRSYWVIVITPLIYRFLTSLISAQENRMWKAGGRPTVPGRETPRNTLSLQLPCSFLYLLSMHLPWPTTPIRQGITSQLTLSHTSKTSTRSGSIPPTMMAGIASIMASKASRIPEQTYSRTMSSKQV